MSDGNKLLTDVSSPYGAPMGRRATLTNLGAKVRLFRVRFVDGDYDSGGAYWGGGGGPLYACIGDDFEAYRRAGSREHAKEKLLKEFPDLKFYR